jgi:cathepsin L
MSKSFKYIKYEGLMFAEDYPNGVDEYPCKFNVTKSKIQLIDYVFLPSGNEEVLKNAVAAVGPICAALDAFYDPLYSYSSGVFYYENCTKNVNQ